MLSDYGQSTASETLDSLGQPLEEYFFCQITRGEQICLTSGERVNGPQKHGDSHVGYPT